MKYKIIPEDTIKNLIEFLDEIQFEAAKVNSTDAHHQVNFCNWAINELLNSYNVKTTEHFGKSKDDKRKPNKKSRDQYVDETFMDWNLPDMTDDEYDSNIRAIDEAFNKKGYSDKEHLPNPSGWNCRFCPFSTEEKLCGLGKQFI